MIERGAIMRAAHELSDGLARLKAILADFPPRSAHWNEAQNRFQFIDRLLVECLGWSHPLIEVENTDEAGGRADYLLGQPLKAVLEAKRETIAFDFPPSAKNFFVGKLRSLTVASKPFEAAVHQVIPYCSIRGAQIAVICNGPQLVIFQALAIGSSPLDGECYVFNGLDSLVDGFVLLWRLMSPDGINENRAYRELANYRNPRIPPKASASLPEPNKYRYRSSFQENLRQLASLLLEDVEDHPDVKEQFYRDCYVKLDANNRHLLLSKNIIASRYRRATEASSQPISANEGLSQIEDGRVRVEGHVLLEAVGARPVVVLGDVGVGKTSFFENLYEGLTSGEKANTYFIHLNLGITATLAADLRPFAISEIARLLKVRYSIDINHAKFVEAVHYRQLQDFEKSVFGQAKGDSPAVYSQERLKLLAQILDNRDAHLLASLGHIAQGRNKQIILVIDNADQRSFETQQQAFLIAQELAATRNILVFIALRPSTFYRSKLAGALSGYQNRVLTISPPPADEVLQRRIAFAVRVAEGKVAPVDLDNIRLNLRNIVLFLQSMLRSIKASDDIKTFLSNITGGNTRLVVELTTAFCGSPNVDSQKIVEIEERSGNYKIPLHEFTKHALLGEYAYFNPASSTVAYNIFDVSAADRREHFLASLVIAFLGSSTGRRDADGFVTGLDVRKEMSRLGFLDDQINFCLRKLSFHRLIETPHGHYREIDVDDQHTPDQFVFRATTIGLYHVRFWTGSFAFIDAVCIDTPIFDENIRAEVFKVAPSFEIKDRLARAEAMLQYLEESWHAANFSAAYYDFSQLVRLQQATFAGVRVHVLGGKRPRPWTGQR